MSSALKRLAEVARRLAASAAIAAPAALGACGGGGGDGGARVDPAAAQDRTGARPPAETSADQSARAAGILERADSFILSTIRGEARSAAPFEFRFQPTGFTGGPDTRSYEAQTVCAGRECTWRIPNAGATGTTGTTGTTALETLGFLSGAAAAVLTKSGIALVQGRAGAAPAIGSGRIAPVQGVREAEQAEFYGAWMDHAGFAVRAEGARIGAADVYARYAVSVGELTGSLPAVSVTWTGLMVGAPQGGNFRDSVLQGDAVVTLFTDRGDAPLIGAAFSNIVDIGRGTAYSVPTVRFANVPVSRSAYGAHDGSFRAGVPGNRIQGGFYGPDHAETAGIFEQAGIIGAFGAKQDPYSILVSTMHGRTNDATSPAFRAAPDCAGAQCRWRIQNTGVSETFDRRRLEVAPGGAGETVAFQSRGLEAKRSRGEQDSTEIEYLRIAMDHATLAAAQAMWDRADNVDITGRFGAAGGNPVRTPPNISAKWSGLMVGAPHEGEFGDNILVGDADLTYTYSDSGGTLDAAFANIQDLSRGEAHSTPGFEFPDVPVSPDGSYRTGSAGDRIHGNFFGAGHAETAGVFEKAGMVGAFGAKRR